MGQNAFVKMVQFKFRNKNRLLLVIAHLGYILVN